MQEAASEEYLSQARKTRNSFIGAENFDAFDQYTRGQGRNEKGQFVGTTQFEYDVNQVGQLTKGSKEYEKAYDRLLKKIYDVTNAQDKQKESIQAMVAARLEEIEASKKLEQASDAEQQKLSQVGTEIQKLKEQKKNGINVTEEQIAALEKEMSQLDENSEAYKKYAAEIAKLKSSQNNGLLGANADKIVKGAQAVSQLTAGITSLTSIWGIWFDKANESIPVGEKLVKTLVAISAGLPMVIMGIKTLGISLTKAGVEGAVGLGVLKGGIDGVTVSILGMEVALGSLLLAIVGIAAVVGII